MRSSKIRILSKPSVTETGAKIILLAIYDKPGCRFAHVYIELNNIATDLSELSPVDAEMFIAQLGERAYNSFEWIEIDHPVGEKEKILAVVNQSIATLDEHTIVFCENLMTLEEEHGWSVNEDGTTVNRLTGRGYTVSYVNEYAKTLMAHLETLTELGGVEQHAGFLAPLIAQPMFSSLYLPDLEASIREEEDNCWDEAVKLADTLRTFAETQCGLGIEITPTK